MQNNSLSSTAGKNQPVWNEANPGGYTRGDHSRTTEGEKAPVILLAATLRWPIAARLAIVFDNMGVRVEAICPRQHPVTRTRAVRKAYLHSVINPLVALRAAIKSSCPDLVIPCDDDAAVHLHQLYMRTGAARPADNALRSLIARSLGVPEACTFATARGRLIALAAEEGVRVPDTTVVATSSELSAWLIGHDYPVVLKLDRTCGGQGISIARNHEEAKQAFDAMISPPAMGNAIARMLLDRDPIILLSALKKSPRTITLQDFIPGIPANRAVACWQGQVLAGISVEAIRTQHATGPATVVRVIQNAEMSDAVNRLVRRLGISGLWGIDFILEASTGAAYLIEMNPRATPVCHLSLGDGRDLLAALYAQLTGTAARVPHSRIDHDVIALFPGELHRDPASPWLQSDYHDVPWEELALIQDCIDRPWSERGLLARWWAHMRSTASSRPVQQLGPVGSPFNTGDVCNHSTPDMHQYLPSSTLVGKKTHSSDVPF